MLGVAFGLGLGTVAGLSVGPQIFGRVYKPKDYYVLDETADLDEDVQTQENAPVTPEMRRLLEFAEPWTTEPDFQRVSMINRCIKTMWPGLSKAIMEEVLKVVKQQLDVQVFKKFAMVENIVLGSMSMNPAAGPDSYGKYVSGKDFFVGDIPPRLGGFKVYDTSDDEGLFELALLWGSNCKFNVGAFIRLGPVRLYVPVEVSNLHFKADVRITLKPLVEVIPCVGGVAISLLRVPHVDFKLSIIGGVDLMALPVIKDGVRLALRLALNQLMVLPNAMSFPIMPNFGLAKPPKGALNVRLLSADVTKGKELYCVMNTRPSRFRTSNISRAHKGTVEWGEEFNFIIDDPQEQVLHMELWEDVLGADKLLGYGYLPLGTTDMSRLRQGEDVPVFEPAQFVKVPMEEHKCAIPLEKVYEEGVKSVLGVLSKTKKPGERSLASAAALREKGDELGAAAEERGNAKVWGGVRLQALARLQMQSQVVTSTQVQWGAGTQMFKQLPAQKQTPVHLRVLSCTFPSCHASALPHASGQEHAGHACADITATPALQPPLPRNAATLHVSARGGAGKRSKQYRHTC
uniref:C2 domain-containing protein n=1 Tax=Chlamydomonas euryale TaxID=1486919 RepID=A0A7R9V5U8_9CHLO|mmetsp:Transcript_20854/g.62335  ORF Transcript_20854/g.62335 Transcript_20854/m.62335 type:complete len:574 (+) Transcript_20854:310-2031(+)